MAEGDQATVGATTAPPEVAKRNGKLPGESTVEQLSEIATLAGRVTAGALTPPFTWWRELVDQAWVAMKRCAPPAGVSAIFIGLALAVQAGSFLDVLGAADRAGSGYVLGSVREFAPFVTGVVVAGVAGTAVCADLGARRIREEFDALAVVGVDIVRQLVVPRVLALTVITAAMNFWTMLWGGLGAGFGSWWLFGVPGASFVGTFTASFSMPDLIGSAVKTAIFGFVIAVICTYKGITVKGGPEGVGRAVNQAVVMCFVAIFVINYAFNSVLLAVFPETTQIR